MTQITVYPRLYTSRREDGDGVLVSKGDSTVDALYAFLLNGNVSVTTWAFQQQVLQTAQRLFGNFQKWLDDQRSNPQMVGYNADFLDDTLKFIQTGEREMSVANWLELVTEGDDTHHAVEPGHGNREISLVKPLTTTQVLQDWCSKPNGLEDLILSLNLFFGHTRLLAK